MFWDRGVMTWNVHMLGERGTSKAFQSLQGGGGNWQFLTVNTFWTSLISIAYFLRLQVFKSFPYKLFVNIFNLYWFNAWCFLKWYSLSCYLVPYNVVLVYKTKNFQFSSKE